jgi:lysozyme
LTIALLAAKLIQVFEGCKLKAYWDKTGKVWTIGFGHTLGVKQGDVCTPGQAAMWLEEDSADLIKLVKDRPLVEAAALVSFGYNLGKLPLTRVLVNDIIIKDSRFWADSSPEGPMVPFGESSGGMHLLGLERRRALEGALVEASRGLL